MHEPKDGAKASGRRYGAPKNWKQTFLKGLAETSNVTASAKAADIALSWVYKTRREDADFAHRWLQALCEGYDNLEMDLLHRLRSGGKHDAEGAVFDNGAAIRLLSLHRTNAARARALRENEDEQAVLDSIDAMIDEMRSRALAHAEIVAAEEAENAAGSDDARG